MAMKRDNGGKSGSRGSVYKDEQGRTNIDLEPGHFKFAAKRNGNGKGDAVRPMNKKLFDENYDRIFGKKK